MAHENLLKACKDKRIITDATEKQWRRLLDRIPEPTLRILEAYRSFPMPFQTARNLAWMRNAGHGKLDSNSPFDETMDPIDWGTGTGRIFPYLCKDFKTLQELEPNTIKELIKTLPIAVAINLAILPPDPQRDLRRSFLTQDGPRDSSKDERNTQPLETPEPHKQRSPLFKRLTNYLLRTSEEEISQDQHIAPDDSMPNLASDEKADSNGPSETGAPSSSIKFPHPKILLLNVDRAAAERLGEIGYDAFDGEIGTPYRVPSNEAYYLIPVGTKLPSHTEQEIIIIDLGSSRVINKFPSNLSTQEGIDYWWAKGKQGFVDPRPGVLASLSEDFTRIWENGGIFIVFAATQLTDQFMRGQLIQGQLRIKETLFIHEWSFLPQLFRSVQPISNKGDEIRLSTEPTGWLQELSHVLQRYLVGSMFECTLQVADSADSRWITIASSKYGHPVAGALRPERSEGWIFFFPQIRDKAAFLLELFSGLLPSALPSVFPHYDNMSWIHDPDHMFHDIQQHRQAIDKARASAEESIKAHEQRITSLQVERQHAYQIVSSTGASLVDAVMRVLQDIGFQKIVNPDTELLALKDNSKNQLREDLQILDRSPALLVEIKGINDLPSEGESLQVTKYIPRRKRDWSRTDIRGLFIVNHQRRHAPNQRQHKNVFQEDVILNAETNEFGVMTTFDLFCLYRNWRRYNWNPRFVQMVFYRSGRIMPIPVHYELVGEIEHFWPRVNSLGIRLKWGTVALQDRIAFEVGLDFEETVIDSLQVDKQTVHQAAIGQLAGIQMDIPMSKLSKGYRVFKITQP